MGIGVFPRYSEEKSETSSQDHKRNIKNVIFNSVLGSNSHITDEKYLLKLTAHVYY